MVIRGKTVRLAPRQLVFIGPDCPFGWASIDDSNCKFLQWMWTEFSSDFSPNADRDGHFIRRIPRGKSQPFRQNHNQCRREVLDYNERTLKYLHGCRLIFEILVERLIESEAGGDQSEKRFQQAQQWMKTHLDSKEPIARLCDYLDVSQSSLYRLFKAATNRSPADFFHCLRMDHAARMLNERGMQVKEVAFLLGYHHFNDFSRAYKAHFGHPPSVRP